MKTNSGSLTIPGRGPAPVALLLAGLVFALVLPTSVQAEIIDDFEDADRSAEIWTSEVLYGAGGQEFLDGHARLFVTPSGEHGFSTLFSVRQWTLREKRTLEFKADLVGSNGDGAIGYLAFSLGDGVRMYALAIDQDTILLAKRASPEQFYFLQNGVPVKSENVKLVLSMTGTEGGVLLQFTVLDNDRDGEVIFRRDYWDTPANDPLQRGVDDPPQSYLGASGMIELSCYHDNAGAFDLAVDLPPQGMAEVVFDNVEVLEYDSAWITGLQTVAVLPTWPENTAEELIPVGADSIDGPWMPWPEPIFNRHGELCVPVCTIEAPHKFVKLVPGTQFVDDFNPPKPPYLTKGEWTPYFANKSDSSRFTFILTNGVFEIRTTHPPVDGQVAIFPPGTDEVVGDFQASVDLLDWSSSQESALGIAGRVQGNRQGVSNMYLGSVRTDRATGTARLWFFDGASNSAASEVVNVDPDTDYRLEFSAVGNQLNLQLVSLSKPQTVIAEGSKQASRFSQGTVALWVNTRGSASYARTLDNFFMTGTKL